MWSVLISSIVSSPEGGTLGGSVAILTKTVHFRLINLKALGAETCGCPLTKLQACVAAFPGLSSDDIQTDRGKPGIWRLLMKIYGS